MHHCSFSKVVMPGKTKVREEINMKARNYRQLFSMIFCFVFLLSLPAIAADFPSKPITFSIDGSPGGGSDTWSRLFFSIAEKHMGVSFVGINKPGGSSAVAFAYTLQQPHDGYTLCTVTPNYIITPLRQKLGFNYKDFTPVALILNEKKVIFVQPGTYETLQDVIAEAKAKPGTQTWGTYGTGTDEHIIMHLLEEEEGLQLQQVAYGGSGEVVTAVLGGHIKVGVAKPSLVLGQIEAGMLKALAVDGHDRATSLPDVPTLGEMGYDIDIPTWRGLVVPKGTPRERVEYLAAKFEEVTKLPEFQEKLIKTLKYDVMFMKGEELDQFLDKENEKLKAILEEMGIETH